MWASALLPLLRVFSAHAPPAAAKAPLFRRLRQARLDRVVLDVTDCFSVVLFIAHKTVAIVILPELAGPTQKCVRPFTGQYLPAMQQLAERSLPHFHEQMHMVRHDDP